MNILMMGPLPATIMSLCCDIAVQDRIVRLGTRLLDMQESLRTGMRPII